MKTHDNIQMIVGPPGTGKTTELSRIARNMASEYSPEAVMILSFTRAAAVEIGGRDTGIPDRCTSTIHARCKRMQPEMRLMQAKHVKEWNADNPQWSLPPAAIGTSTETGSVGQGQAAKLHQEADLNVAKMLPKNEWFSNTLRFYDVFKAWREASDLCTFTDILLSAYELRLPPLMPDEEGRLISPQAILVDEVQDLSRLELEIINQWSSHVEEVIMVGDLHQMIYDWRGASPEMLLSHESRILDQSYRVPREVHKVAMKLMKQIESIPHVVFRPRDADGRVHKCNAKWGHPNSVDPYIKEAISSGKDLMIVASCDYMMAKITRHMRETGVPFWNPFAKSRAKWNPLHYKVDSGRLSFPDMVRIYLRGRERGWTPAEMKSFMPMFKNVLTKGGMKILKEIDDFAGPEELTDVLLRVVRDECLDDLYDCDPLSSFTTTHIRMNWREKLAYIQRVIRRYGVSALSDDPKIVVGTIHSVKGGEADTVLVFPDLSRKFVQSYWTPGVSGRDSILRMFYVAVTRARETLLIGRPTGFDFLREI